MSLDDEFATLSLHIDKQSNQPLYIQLANQIHKLIEDKRLAPAQRLPSSRKLAELLGVSRTSTINACEHLIAQGYLITKPSSGVYVSNYLVGKTEQDSLPAKLSSQVDNEKKHDIAGFEEDCFTAFDSGPDVNLFPFDEWARCSARVWRNQGASALHSFPLGGNQALKTAVVNYLKVLRNIDCSEEQVIITAGSRDALALISKVILENKKAASSIGQVALENPSYPPLHFGFKTQNCELSYCEIDQQGAIVPNQRVDLAWLTAAKQYPLGISMSTQRRLEWLNYSQTQQSWIIEDDYDSEFYYQKTTLASLFSMSKYSYAEEQQRVILTGSFSKILFRTLRLGFMVVPRILIKPFHKAQQQLGNVASLPTQIVLADFLKSRRFFSHMRKMKKHYQKRRDYLCHLLASELAAFVSVDVPNCGTHLIVRPVQGKWLIGIDFLDREILANLGCSKINEIALSAHYSVESNAKQGFILGFSGSSEREMLTAVMKLKRLFQTLTSKS
jgi:GntR family transcriptional regulator/MocR family aminotransferase